MDKQAAEHNNQSKKNGVIFANVLATSPLTRTGTNILEKMRQNSPKVNRYFENKSKSILVNEVLN